MKQALLDDVVLNAMELGDCMDVQRRGLSCRSLAARHAPVALAGLEVVPLCPFKSTYDVRDTEAAKDQHPQSFITAATAAVYST